MKIIYLVAVLITLSLTYCTKAEKIEEIDFFDGFKQSECCEEFQVLRGNLSQNEFGYQFRSEDLKYNKEKSKFMENFAFAMKKLDKPLLKRAIIKAKFKAANPPRFLNGFLVFGEALSKEKLMRVGVFIGDQNYYLGPVWGGDETIRDENEFDHDKTFDMKVIVDLQKQNVSYEVDGHSYQLPIKDPIEKIEWVGYSLLRSISDFSSIEVEGE